MRVQATTPAPGDRRPGTPPRSASFEASRGWEGRRPASMTRYSIRPSAGDRNIRVLQPDGRRPRSSHRAPGEPMSHPGERPAKPRTEEILDVATRLFAERGYDGT